MQVQPNRPTIRATCQNGYDGIVSYTIVGLGDSHGPIKAPTSTLVALLVTNHRLSMREPPIKPSLWKDKALIQNARHDNIFTGKSAINGE